MTNHVGTAGGERVYLGIDVGSTTVKVVVLDAGKCLLESHYQRSRGQSAQTVFEVLADVLQRIPAGRVAGLGLTGSGGELVATLLGGSHINELVAQTRAVGEFCPDARTVIEMGGQDSKLLILERDLAANKTVLVDFAMNNLCAAGTGSFLDQQADRLGVRIESEFEEIALRSASPARVAGRCTVFAKSDMIHLQQKGVPLPDILAGLCHAVARNFKGTIGKGKRFERPMVFQGGVAYNKAMVRAFENVLGLAPGELIIPRHHNLMSALGTAFIAMDSLEGEQRFAGLGPLADYLASERSDRRSMAPLSFDFEAEKKLFTGGIGLPKHPDGPIPVFLGVDVGSISTNVVLIDKSRHVVARRYLRTEGKPLEAVRTGLQEIGAEVGAEVIVAGVGVTGSGRHLTGHFVGADVVRNEITAQATAAISIDPTVDTIFEIGGQDSKYIRLENGAIVDFEMNKACAAGTGSFLEEQADKLEIEIEKQFADLALQSKSPSCLGQRCTVFMESDLVAHQQSGAKKDELVAGLAYSIVLNYLNNVVKDRKIGDNVFFQGGVAWNKSVAAAFEKTLGKKVIVPPHHDVTGAIGAAILAMREMEGRKTSFHGFDLSDREYQVTAFECRACPNICEVSKVVLSGSEPIFFGARCERFEDGRKANRGQGIPDLFEERERWLFGSHYTKSRGPRPEDSPAGTGGDGRPRVGIPRVLTSYDMFPYWSTFFEELGLQVVLSDATNPSIVHTTTETAVVDACFPIKVVHGHVLNLVEKGVDFVFVPSIINRERTANHEQCYLCPYVQAVPYVVKAAIDFDALGVKLLTPYIYFMRGDRHVQKVLEGIAKEVGKPARAARPAMAAAKAAQHDFTQRLRHRGAEIMEQLHGDRLGVVLVGRPYNTCDPGLNMDLPSKLRSLGVVPIPLDFLPVEDVYIAEEFSNMFWYSGQRIIAAARLAQENDNLFAVYLTSYGCGPDSFIISFFHESLAGKPFLQLEIDDHSGDAGTVTRCEAFLDSIHGLRQAGEMAAPSWKRKRFAGAA